MRLRRREACIDDWRPINGPINGPEFPFQGSKSRSGRIYRSMTVDIISLFFLLISLLKPTTSFEWLEGLEETEYVIGLYPMQLLHFPLQLKSLKINQSSNLALSLEFVPVY